MPIAGTGSGSISKAAMVSFVKTFIADEANAIANLRQYRELRKAKDRAQEATLVHVYYKRFFEDTAPSGSGDVYDTLTDRQQGAILSWLAKSIDLQIDEQTVTGSTS